MDSRTSNPMSINQLVQAVLDENPGTEHTYVAQNHRVENERKRRYAAMIGLEVAKRMQQRAVVEPKVDGPFEVYFVPSTGARGIIDDGPNDAKLTVDGIFESDDEKREYISELAAMLNKAVSEKMGTAEPPETEPFYVDGMSFEQWREHAKEGWRQAAALRAVPPTVRGTLSGELIEAIEQVRRAHKSAKPKAPENPAWFHAENDIGFLLDCIDKLASTVSPPSSDAPAVSPLEMARCFHETYERLAPHYGYATREATREFNAHSDNGRLMIAVCAEIIAAYSVSQPRVEWISVKDKLPEFGQAVVYFFSLVGSHVGHYDGQDQHGLPVFAGRNGFLAGDVTHWIPLPPRPVPYSGSTKSVQTEMM
jgi:hypothetical protein